MPVARNRKPCGRTQAPRRSTAAAGQIDYVAAGVMAVLLVAAAKPLVAADLGNLGGFDIRLDSTLRLSLGLRLQGQDPAQLSNANGDDGDRAFNAGVISERLDFTSVLDATRGNLGFEISADGWYDAVYHKSDANHAAVTFNPVTVRADRFPADVRRLMGDTVELGTAYVHDRFDIGGVPVTVRLGRQSVLWGESLFFPQDGIAAGMAPVDEIKALSQPLVEDQEVYLPIDQLYVRADLGHGFSVQAYEQLEWRRNRDPGVASYFSGSDVSDTGGQRLFLPGNGVLPRSNDLTPGGFDQFGVALRYASDVLDLGLYALRTDSKEGFVQSERTSYRLVFPRDIGVLGASVATYIGDDTVAGEISVRRHMPLVSSGFAPVSSIGLAGASVTADTFSACRSTNSKNMPGIAIGDTLLALASFQRQLPTGRLWQGASLAVEISTTELLDVQSAGAALPAGATRFSSAAEAVFTPQYFQVLPGLDLTLPVGAEWGVSGRSSVDPGQVARVGNVTLSVSATLRSVWQFGVSYTHFLGPELRQPLADRDFLTFSLGRTF